MYILVKLNKNKNSCLLLKHINKKDLLNLAYLLLFFYYLKYLIAYLNVINNNNKKKTHILSLF